MKRKGRSRWLEDFNRCRVEVEDRKVRRVGCKGLWTSVFVLPSWSTRWGRRWCTDLIEDYIQDVDDKLFIASIVLQHNNQNPC